MASASVQFHRLAVREFRDARRWYALRSPLAAQRFIDAVDHAVQRIAGAPDRWPVYQGPHLWVRLQRFPYVLYYRVIDPDEVLIVALAHSRRRPGYWRRRTP
jgi:plasmid stabilization system protein ParE